MFATEVRAFADRLVDELAPPTAVETASGDCGRLVCRLDRVSTVGVDDAEILSAIVEVARARNVLDAAQSVLVRAAERAGVPARRRVRSAAGLLTAIGVAPAVAHRTVRNGRHADRLEVVGRGTRDGSLSSEMADAIGKGVALIEQRVDVGEAQRQRLARKLVVHATPGDVATAARREAIGLDAQAGEPGQIPVAENAGLNEMSLTVAEDGRITSTIDVDVLTGEELYAALDPLCRPIPLSDGSPDPRSTGQRRADALGQIIRTYLSGSARPTSGGVLPHATLVVPAVGDRSTGPATDGVARLGFTGPVSSSTVGLALCSAAVSAVRVDGEGVPLDVGREHRLFPPGIRKALAVRDGGCAFPGCGRPVSWTDAHHCVPWSQGGDTSLGNGVLLCRMHHVHVHQGGWEVSIGRDGHPWFRQPVDPAHPNQRRELLRSHARRTMTIEPTAA
ncbi:HNH endonuclease signature motif containing protein [Gordonia sp. MP11Mi]|uniref:HNH nuclease domain-containing protein n=1 Tax=Gordonia sp. MP11Mi TaxID=3022769 RepID=A0AA97GTC3_9ACTN